MEPTAGESTAAGATFSMSSKRRGLGRGLDALLGASAGAHVAAAFHEEKHIQSKINDGFVFYGEKWQIKVETSRLWFAF